MDGDLRRLRAEVCEATLLYILCAPLLYTRLSAPLCMGNMHYDLQQQHRSTPPDFLRAYQTALWSKEGAHNTQALLKPLGPH